MEYALTADHHRVHALDAEKGQEYYCPVCGNQVIPRQGEVNSWHFAHVTSCVDDWKYDSPNGIATGRIDSPNPPERWSLSIKESLIELIS